MGSFVLRVEISMSRMHVIEFRLKLEPKLHLLLVVLGVLHVLFLQLESHLAFTLSLLLESVIVFL